jgi:hypothetical protein
LDDTKRKPPVKTLLLSEFQRVPKARKHTFRTGFFGIPVGWFQILRLPQFHVVFPKEVWHPTYGKPKGARDEAGADIRQGTLRPMVLNALDVLGPLHGYTIAQYAEQISEALLAVNQGTLYPVLLRLERVANVSVV